jgi:hypothetical protein
MSFVFSLSIGVIVGISEGLISVTLSPWSLSGSDKNLLLLNRKWSCMSSKKAQNIKKFYDVFEVTITKSSTMVKTDQSTTKKVKTGEVLSIPPP